MQRVKKYTEEIFKTGYLDFQGNDILLKRRCDNETIEWYISHYGLGASVPFWTRIFESYENLQGYENLDPDNFENDYQQIIREEKLERICK